MKNVKKIILLLLLMFHITVLCAGKYDYEFPLNPHMEEWRTLPVDVKNQMLQIPEEKLDTISTGKLIGAYLNNPLSVLILAYDIPRSGYMRVYKEFNGLRELNLRDDGPVTIMEIYSGLDPGEYDPTWSSKKRWDHVCGFEYLEVLLAQPEIYSHLNLDDSRKLMSILVQKYDKKLLHYHIYGMSGLRSCVYAMAKILDYNSVLSDPGYVLSPAMRSFIETGYMPDPEMINDIIPKAVEFCK